MSEFGGAFEEELRRIRSTLRLDSKASLAGDVNEFLGRTDGGSTRQLKTPKYLPFFPFDALSAYRHLSEGHASPDRDLENHLIAAFQKSAPGTLERTRATNALLKAYIRFVIHRSKFAVRFAVPQEELVQEAIFGLLRAAEKADTSLGNRFSTYAGNWIDQTIRRYVADHSRTVRIPVYGHEIIKKAQAIRRSDFLHGRPPRSMANLEAETEVTPGSLEKLLEADTMTTSLEQWQKKNDLPDPMDIESVGEALELRRDLEIALDQLHPRESAVLRMRFGISTGEEATLTDIGNSFGLTRERIRQIEKKGLERLRLGPLSRKLSAHAGLLEATQVDHVELEPEIKRPKKIWKPEPLEKHKKPKPMPSNLQRTRSAASEAIGRVRIKLEEMGDKAPVHLREAGELRIRYPMESLAELARRTQPAITKDTYASRLRRFLELTQQDIEQTKTLDRDKDASTNPPEAGIQDQGRKFEISGELWGDILRRVELSLMISADRISQTERESCEWLLSRRAKSLDEVLRDSGGIEGLRAIVLRIRYLIGDPWR